MSFLDDPRFDVGVGLVTAEALGLAALLVTAITLGVRGDRRIARGNRGGLGLPRDEHLDRARFHYALTAREGDKALREGTCVRSVDALARVAHEYGEGRAHEKSAAGRDVPRLELRALDRDRVAAGNAVAALDFHVRDVCYYRP